MQPTIRPKEDEQTSEANCSEPVIPFSPWLTLVCSAQPFFWAQLPVVSLAIPTAVSLVFIATGLLHPCRMLEASVKFYKQGFWFHTFYLMYFVLLGVALTTAPSPVSAFTALASILLTFTCYLGIGTRLMDIDSEGIKNSLLFGSLVGLVAFVVYSQHVFSVQGQSLPGAIKQAISSETPQFGARLMKAIVNFSNADSSRTGAIELSGAVRNTLAACLTFFFFSGALCLTSKHASCLRIAPAMLMIIICPLITLLLASRSSLLSIVIGIAVLVGVVACHASSALALKKLCLAVLLVTVTGSIFVILNAERIGQNPIVAANIDRLSSVQSDPRTVNYRLAVDEVLHSPYIGRGPGAQTPDGHTVHNLLLGAWFEAGVLGAIVATAMYFCLIQLWYKRTFLSAQQVVSTLSLAFMPASAAAMMTGPIIRRMISGNGGRFAFVELFSVAVFIALTQTTSQTKEKGPSNADETSS